MKTVFTVFLFSAFLIACERPKPAPEKASPTVALIPDTATMVTAWDVPRNPLTDHSLDNSSSGEQIRYGFRIFTNTQQEAPRFSRNKLKCNRKNQETKTGTWTHNRDDCKAKCKAGKSS